MIFNLLRFFVFDVPCFYRNGGMPLLVSTDQEGGAVSRIKLLFPGFKFYSPKEMQTMTEDQIRVRKESFLLCVFDFELFPFLKAHGAEVGKRILESGVNMLLAPTLDVADPGTLMDKQGRRVCCCFFPLLTKLF